VGMIDVQPSAVGEDHVRQAEILVGQLRGVRCLAVRSNPRASLSGFSSSKSQRARRALAAVAAW